MTGNDDLVSIVRGEVNPDLVSVYSIIRNEMFFLPAFLDHYRRMGVRQFFFLDDQSDDGTFEFLAEQPDCVLARSPLRYGDVVEGQTALHVWKTEIPRRFMPGQWAICADADELLFLPPQFSTIDQFVQVLDQRGTTAVPAVMVDFYPETVQQMESLVIPRNPEELFSSYPWFDAGPYFQWDPGRTLPKAPFGGVRARLLKNFGISRKKPKSWLKRFRNKIRDRRLSGPWVAKVPLVKWSPTLFYRNSHSLNIAPDTSILLPIAHFKFTSDLYRRISMTTMSEEHVLGSREHHEYADLMAEMKAKDGSFLGKRSMKFTSVADFERTGLMKFAMR